MNKIEKDFNKKLTKKDYFLYLLNRNTFILISPVIIIALIVVFAFMVKKDGFQTGDILYLLPILLFLLSYVQMNNAINRALKLNENTECLQVTLEENKYVEKTSNGINSLEYDKFYSYYESKNYFYLYVDKVNALILPKREFTNEELKTIDGYFSKHITKTKKFNLRTILGLAFSLALVTSMVILIIMML